MSVISSLIAGFLAIQPAPASDALCHRQCAISDTGLQVIRTFEGYSPTVYKDSAGLDTIGFGHLIRSGEKFDFLDPHSAEKLLRKDVGMAERAVNGAVSVKLKQHQFDAQVSFTFNVGSGAFKKSTLLRKVNAGRHNEVPPQFMRWVFAGGVKVTGLQNRRTAEASLYEGVP